MIWIGTQDGLVRWDGYRPRIFRNDPHDPFSLPANFVTGLTVDDEGQLFVATNTGAVARFDPTHEDFTPLPTVTTATGIIYNAIIKDGKAGIWVGNSNGLSFYDQRTNRWETADLPAGTKVWSLLLAKDQTLWVGTDQGLLWRPSGTKSFVSVAGVSESSISAVRALYQSADGAIWFGKNDGIVGTVAGDGKVRLVDMIKPASSIHGIQEIRPGILCVATTGAGLNLVDEASGAVIQSIRYDPGRPSGIGGNLIYSEFLDNWGGLWVTHQHGADYLAPGTDAFLSLLPSDRDASAFSGTNVSAVFSRPDGSIWIGTEAGNDLIDPLKGREEIEPAKTNSVKLPAGLTYAFASSGPDQIWIATGRGLFLREGGQLRKFLPLADTQIRSLFSDKNILWIGTERLGLMRLDLKTNELTSFAHDPNKPDSISDNWVYSITRDHEGRLWVATSRGLNLFNEGRFTHFLRDPSDPDSLPSDTTLTLLVDRQDRLWIGTQGGGAAVLDFTSPDTPHFRHIGHSDGLTSDNVGMLIEDGQGQIWASTDTGLARIDPATFSSRVFGTGDGLAIPAYWSSSGARTSDGTIVFGGVGGLTIVHPDRLSDAQTPPPPVVPIAIRVGGKSVAPLQPLILPPSDHNLQVEFAALNYAAPEKVNYAYKLAGFDENWTFTDADHRLAAYTNLPPGHYALLLRGSSRKDSWTDPATKIPLTVLPAWYQTIWFTIALVLAAIGAVVIFVRSRTALLRRRQKELELQIAERTAEIASLLHNSGEGFLSFGADLIIDRQYSRACETFLGEIPAGKNAAALLFAESPRQASFIAESVPTALSASDEHKRDLILSLLPKEIDRRGRRLRIHYAIIENGHLMVVLRDVTTERRLAARVASEHRRLEMIVAVMTDSRDFFEAVSTFQIFVGSELQAILDSAHEPSLVLKDVYRAVHTFKGVFSQFSLEKTPAALHKVEESLDRLQRASAATLSDIYAVFETHELFNELEQDLTLIRQALGDEFMTKGGQVTMPPEQAARLKALAALWRESEKFDPNLPDVKELLDAVDRLGTVCLRTELAAYDQTIAQVARRMEKEVAPLVVIGGEDIWLDPDHYGVFLRSLIHVFRNCVAHGIEAPEARMEEGKEELGVISCHVDQVDNELTITISDDGAGVNVAALRRRLVQTGRIKAGEIEKVSENDILDFVFHDNITTSISADDWSGRGVGLSAVRREVEKLGGRASVETFPGKGTRFILSMPLGR